MVIMVSVEVTQTLSVYSLNVLTLSTRNTAHEIKDMPKIRHVNANFLLFLGRLELMPKVANIS